MAIKHELTATFPCRYCSTWIIFGSLENYRIAFKSGKLCRVLFQMMDSIDIPPTPISNVEFSIPDDIGNDQVNGGIVSAQD